MIKKVFLATAIALLAMASVCMATRGDLTWYNSAPTYYTAFQADMHIADEKAKGVPEYVTSRLGASKYNIKAYQIKYWSINATNQPTLVSGMVLVPQRPKTQVAPVLIWQHATQMANSNMPSIINSSGDLSPEAELMASTMATQGYVVVMSDFVGAGLCTEVPQEYLIASSEAANGVDAYIAAKQLFASINAKTNNKLFLAGYSQGGQAVAALAQTMQNSYPQYPVTAAAFMEGPYDMTMELQHLLQPGGVALDDAPVGTLISCKAVASLSNTYNWGQMSSMFVAPYDKYVLPDFNNPNTSLAKMVIDFPVTDTTKILTPTFLAALNNPSSQQSQDIIANAVYKWAPKMPVILLTSKVDTLIPCTISEMAYNTMKGMGGNVTLEYTGLPLNHLQNGMPATANAYQFFSKYL